MHTWGRQAPASPDATREGCEAAPGRTQVVATEPIYSLGCRPPSPLRGQQGGWAVTPQGAPLTWLSWTADPGLPVCKPSAQDETQAAQRETFPGRRAPQASPKEGAAHSPRYRRILGGSSSSSFSARREFTVSNSTDSSEGGRAANKGRSDFPRHSPGDSAREQHLLIRGHRRREQSCRDADFPAASLRQGTSVKARSTE